MAAPALAIALLLSSAALAAEPGPGRGAQDAQQFVADAERQLAYAVAFEDRAGWVEATNITPDTDWLLERALAEKAALGARLAAEARRFDRSKLDPTTRRKLELLTRLVDMPAPSRPGAAAELAQVSNRLASSYATGTFSLNGKTYTLREAEAEIGASRDPERTRALWEGWRTVAAPMRADYVHMVQLGNEGARSGGYADVGAMWRSDYDMPPEQFQADVSRLWGQLAPLYKDLHCYVRGRLNAKYGDAIQPRSGPIRADLVGNMWGQDWSPIYDLVGPASQQHGGGLTEALQQHGYDAEKMVRAAEQFYISLGFAPLPKTFWERSQFTRPPGRNVDCNSSAWDIDEKSDVRIKTCFQVREPDWNAAHHELGHDYYSLAIQGQPVLFRDAANPGVSEGMGDFIALSTNTKADLTTLGLADAANGGDEIAPLLNVALAKLPLLAFAISVDEWRWGVFSGKTQPDAYNTAWWNLVESQQGLRAPRPRAPEMNDALAKYHLTNNVPYISYFMATVYQFQFYRAACQMAGWKGPLNACTLRGKTEVGARLQAMMALGRSQPAPLAIAAFTGEQQADASAIVDYFAPLQVWLREQNRGAECGW